MQRTRAGPLSENNRQSKGNRSGLRIFSISAQHTGVRVGQGKAQKGEQVERTTSAEGAPQSRNSKTFGEKRQSDKQAEGEGEK